MTEPQCLEYEFLEALPGLDSLSRYQIVVEPQYEPFLFLSSLEEESITLTLIDPFLVDSAYQPQVNPAQLAPFDLGSEDSVFALYVVVAPGSRGLGANLAAPILFHRESRRALQVILEDPTVPLFAPLSQSQVAGQC